MFGQHEVDIFLVHVFSLIWLRISVLFHKSAYFLVSAFLKCGGRL